MAVKFKRKNHIPITVIWGTLKCFAKMIYNFVVGSTIDGVPQTSLLSILSYGKSKSMNNSHLKPVSIVFKGCSDKAISQPDFFASSL